MLNLLVKQHGRTYMANTGNDLLQ